MNRYLSGRDTTKGWGELGVDTPIIGRAASEFDVCTEGKALRSAYQMVRLRFCRYCRPFHDFVKLQGDEPMNINSTQMLAR